MKKFSFIFYLLLSCLFLEANAGKPHAPAGKKTDKEYMELAVAIAKHNPKYPFGALIVDNKTGKILAQGLNDSNKTHNPTHHGEMVAINNCVKNHPNVDWKNTTLYTTAEPCSMCQSAIVWAGISRVVYGTSIDNLQHFGWNQIDIASETINSRASFYKGKVKGDVLDETTDALFRKATFFSRNS